MHTNFHHVRRHLLGMAILALLLSTVIIPVPAYAQAPTLPSAPGLVVDATQAGIHLTYQPGVQAASVTAANLVPYGGYLLPIQTVMVELPGGPAAQSVAAAATIQQLSSSPYTSALTPAPVLVPPALDWEPDPARLPVIEPRLPSAPLFVMHEGMERNRHVAVVAFSSIYQDPTTGEVRQVDSLDALVAGATAAAEVDASADPNDAALFSPVADLAGAPAPTNPLANATAVKIYVDAAGVQQVTGAQLAAAGLNTPNTAKLRLFLKGVEVPLQIIDGNNNKVLEAGDAVRFYAPTVGDVNNTESVYWMSAGAADGLRMAGRAVTPAGAQARTTAYEVGAYGAPAFWDSTLPGGDGDGWYHADLRVAPGDAVNPSTAVTLTHALPLIPNNSLPTLLTLHLTAYAVNNYGQVPHRLALATTGYTYTDEGDDWIVTFTSGQPYANAARTFTLAKTSDKWSISLLKGNIRLGIKVDTVDYLLPVQLNFGGKGARIQGIEGTWRYQLTNTAAGRTLYDITNPAQPQLLTVPGGTNFEFQDGPTAKRYLLTGPGTLVSPRAVVAHTAVNMGAAGGAHALYIAPKEFHATLQPLVDLRTSQGYTVRVVDVESIYDAWGWGMVSPAAIRSFLRFAVGNWQPSPTAATLVGDGTVDPHDYLGYGNPNIIPPYMLDVDPWLRVTACENCFAQLNGDSPLSETAFLPDIWLGRFPVIDTTELAAVVAKIVAYETATDTQALWRRTSLQVTDDYIKPDGSQDNAGNFYESAESTVAPVRPFDSVSSALWDCALSDATPNVADTICEHIVANSSTPVGVKVLRHYYMAADDISGLPADLQTLLNILKPWFATESTAALKRTINLINSDVGLVTYTGHANHWQWARTENLDSGKAPGYLMGLWEVLQLRNRTKPFIALEMTCYTAQFTKPERSHFTLDEHLLLYEGGGAVAVWGPAGLSVAHGHDQLQQGFYAQLWKSPLLEAKMGALTQAGYKSVVETPFTADCCMDVNHTFLLLGDPLMPARVAPMSSIKLPIVQSGR